MDHFELRQAFEMATPKAPDSPSQKTSGFLDEANLEHVDSDLEREVEVHCQARKIDLLRWPFGASSYALTGRQAARATRPISHCFPLMRISRRFVAILVSRVLI